ncbi:MAG: acyl carrier protein [Deltaproteobacteria bacterium]|nr:acyl carrier protein [Deltaproteobacteria bacterium]
MTERTALEDLIRDEKSLVEYLKKWIIETLKLEDVKADQIDAGAPLFREGLGLDSIDALELVVALEREFKVVIEDEDVGKKAFASIDALAAFIREERGLGA